VWANVGVVPKVLVAVLAGLVTCQFALMLTTLYLHRTVSHRAVTMRPGLAFACRACVWISTGIRPREWAAVHRRHHAYTDIQGDPHSPVLEGYWKVQLYNVGLYKKAAHDAETLRKYSRDIKVDRWDKVVFDRGFVGLGLGYCVLWLLLGWRWALVAAGVHVVSYLVLNAAINAIGHRFGKAPYPGVATNNRWLALFTWGEGLHSNHHAAPTAARFSFTSGELDHGWLVITLFKKLGWLQVRHSSIHLTAAAQQGRPPGDVQQEPEPEAEPELV
jgi:stearoyl-CoA desaturase (Delta-9 desaturase)